MSRILRGESFYDRYGVDPTGLVLWLDQSDTRSYGDVSDWYDLSGNGNHGQQATAANQPVITGSAGLAGMSRKFDGVDDYIDVVSPTGLTQVRTQGVWVKPENVAGNIYIIDEGGNNNWIQIFSNIVRAGTSVTNAYDDSTMTVSNGVWYHIVSVFNGDTLSLYINGDINNGFSVSAAGNTPTDLIIGSTSGGYSFNGYITIVHIWNRALSAAEIQRIYLVDAPRFGKL
jgi:hypothetical protein